MVTYEFYKGSYLGSAIPENAFSGVASRAEAVLQKMKRVYTIRSGGEMAESLAVCSMAEAIYHQESRKPHILQSSMGEVSVRYTDPAGERRTLNRELYRRAAIYLDIYRGVAM